MDHIGSEINHQFQNSLNCIPLCVPIYIHVHQGATQNASILTFFQTVIYQNLFRLFHWPFTCVRLPLRREKSHLPTGTLLALPLFFANLRNAVQVTKDQRSSWCAPTSPNPPLALQCLPTVFPESLNAQSTLPYSLFWHCDKMTEHLSFWILCRHLSFFMGFFFPPLCLRWFVSKNKVLIELFLLSRGNLVYIPTAHLKQAWAALRARPGCPHSGHQWLENSFALHCHSDSEGHRGCTDLNWLLTLHLFWQQPIGFQQS